MNSVNLVGRICYPPKSINISAEWFCFFTVCVRRPYGHAYDYFACRAKSYLAAEISRHFREGDIIGVNGWIEVRRRPRGKGYETLYGIGVQEITYGGRMEETDSDVSGYVPQSAIISAPSDLSDAPW